MNSILSSIKDSLGISESDKNFDSEIIPLINRTFLPLRQLGVKPVSGARVTSELDTWESIFGELEDIDAVRTYVYLKVKLVFDPPSSGSVLKHYEDEIDELEWRINVQAETPDEEVVIDES